MNEKIKLIALDVDGTLLRSDKTIDPGTVDDIRWAVENDVETAFCTGRGLAEMGYLFEMLPMMRFAVCNSGAVVYDRKKDSCIYRNEIQQSFIREIMNTAANYPCMPHFLTERESIVSASDITHMADFHMGIYQPMFLRVARTVADMREENERHEAIAKINFYFRTVEDLKKAFDELKHLPLTVSRSENTTMEMTAPGVSKGDGIRQLAAYLEIFVSQTAGIGDNYNDVDMLTTVGLPIAMGNAIPEVQELCAFVTDDNDHNGVGTAIRKIVSRSR